jgi:hypothetical protein
MFKIKGWIKDKEKIEIESSGLDDFFVWFYREQVKVTLYLIEFSRILSNSIHIKPTGIGY